MDFVLLGVVSLCFFKGYFKGFVSTVLSLVGSFAVVLLAWKLSGLCFEWFKQLSIINNAFSGILNNVLNGALPGSFANMEQLQAAVSSSNLGLVFGFLLGKLVGSISFDGEMTAGQIFAPILNDLILKVLAFAVLFIAIALMLRIVRFILNKMINVCGFSFGNRVLGGFVGVVKGIIIFSIFYVVVLTLATFLLNKEMLSFSQSGIVSNFLYNNFINKIITLFY